MVALPLVAITARRPDLQTNRVADGRTWSFACFADISIGKFSFIYRAVSELVKVYITENLKEMLSSNSPVPKSHWPLTVFARQSSLALGRRLC